MWFKHSMSIAQQLMTIYNTTEVWPVPCLVVTQPYETVKYLTLPMATTQQNMAALPYSHTSATHLMNNSITILTYSSSLQPDRDQGYKHSLDQQSQVCYQQAEDS